MINKIIIFLALTFILCSFGCTKQQTNSPVFDYTYTYGNKPIPNDYSSYTFLLTPSFISLEEFTLDKKQKLFNAVTFLGQSVGKNNLVISHLSENGKYINKVRSRTIVNLFNNYVSKPFQMSYDDSVIICYSNYNPEEPRPDYGYFTAITFNNTDIIEIVKVLDRLAQAIETQTTDSLFLEKKRLQLTFREIAENSQLQIGMSTGTTGAVITVKGKKFNK